MKKFIGILTAVVLMLLLASPVLAASLGISPSLTELEVPSDGSATANFKVHYFSGDLKISLVDIPLRVEPETIHIEPSSEPAEIELTIYGDESLGSWIYDGYVRFLGMSGGTVAVAVEVKAKITNLVAGETPVLATPEESQPLLEEEPEETTTEESPEQAPEEATTEVTSPIPEEQAPMGESEEQSSSTPEEQAPTGESEEQSSLTPGSSSFPILPVAGIAAGTIIIITLIVVIARRRYQY